MDPASAAPRRRTMYRPTGWMRSLTVLAAIPVLLYAAVILVLRVPGRFDFLVHGFGYGWLVWLVKALPPPPPGEERCGSMGPAFWRPLRGSMLRPRSRGTYVCFTRSKEGAYSITLFTASWGHFGHAGYLFSDRPPVRIKRGGTPDFDGYADVEAPGDMWTLGGQVATRWWTIWNNLD